MEFLSAQTAVLAITVIGLLIAIIRKDDLLKPLAIIVAIFAVGFLLARVHPVLLLVAAAAYGILIGVLARGEMNAIRKKLGFLLGALFIVTTVLWLLGRWEVYFFAATTVMTGASVLYAHNHHNIHRKSKV